MWCMQLKTLNWSEEFCIKSGLPPLARFVSQWSLDLKEPCPGKAVGASVLPA